MSFWFLVVTLIAYTGVAFSEIQKGNYPMVLVFGAYAISNVGFIWEIYR